MNENDLWISDVLENVNLNFNNIFNIDNELDNFKGVQDSKYYNEDEYLNLIKEKDSLGKKLKIISLNIANLFSKLCDFKTFLEIITSFDSLLETYSYRGPTFPWSEEDCSSVGGSLAYDSNEIRLRQNISGMLWI